MLKIKDLSFTYHNSSQPSDLNAADMKMCFNLTVQAGEILSIIGASGSGKTTLLNLIAGFNQATSGQVLLNNQDISPLDVTERPVTTIFQAHNLFPHLDIFTNVALGILPSLKLDANQKQRVENALESVGLASFTKRKPAQLSGGQQQRVALARALVRKQKILLLDEPLAALGPAMRDEIIDLLKTLVSDNGMVALLVSHQTNDALRASKNSAFIQHGKVLELCKTNSMINHPQHPEIKSYLGSL